MRKLIKWEEEHFKIKRSTISGAGKGLFTKVKLQKGDTIGEYKGKILTDKQADRKPYVNSDYIFWVCKDHNIWGEGPLANYTRYINHDDVPNLQFVVSTRWKKTRVEVLKRIMPNSELFIDYGPDYWDGDDEE